MKNIQNLIDFFEAIPSESWTKQTLSSWTNVPNLTKPEQNCAFGHLNKHLNGTFNYGGDFYNPDSWKLAESLGLDPSKIIYANNYGPDDAKTNVINFLKGKLEEVSV
jgi:hypothetical protein